MPDHAPIARALLSVSDKSGLLDFASALVAHGVELLSTGGTAKALREAGLPVRDVAEVTGFPEMMDGRVKTLHPMIHGGLLALRDNREHVAAMEAHGIGTIDLLVVNLYPFEATVAAGADYDTCIENIDIGGPAMIRAGAKNHGAVTVLTDPAQYGGLLEQLDATSGTSFAFRQRMAQAAYARTAAYDAAVSNWMAVQADIATPPYRAFAGALAQEMRYGENPHQCAAFYRDGSVASGRGHGHAASGQGALATTTSTTPTPRSSLWPSSSPRTARPSPSSSTPTPVAWRAGPRWWTPIAPRSIVTAPPPSVGSWR